MEVKKTTALNVPRLAIIRLLENRIAAMIKAAELENSRPLDVHTWSDHPETNAFVDAIYDAHFKGRKVAIQKKHLKVVLLDLYLAWCQDPALKIAYSRNVNDYRARSRYNALHISKLTIDVVDRLIEVDLVDHAEGFRDRVRGIGRLSRMWPTEALAQTFKEARFCPLDMGGYEDREVIVLRDEEGNEKEYEDTVDTERMREVLKSYNELLRATFIDIPTLDEPYIALLKDKFGRQHRLWINQRDKFVRRIFNRSSFEKGGRFSGGWWQNCPKEWRGKIFINDEATSEIDYSGLHIVMLYAKEGINYWTEIGGDPYQLAKPDFLESNQQTRSVAKQLLLVALNAANEKEAFGAFRYEAAAGSAEKHLTDKQLGSLLERLQEKHSPIAKYLAADAGIDLMNQDAQITEGIIRSFTERSVPILTIHDSYIVPCGEEEALEQAMQTSFEGVTGIKDAKFKEETERPEAIVDRGFMRKAMDMRNPSLNALMAIEFNERVNPHRTNRYNYQWEEFRKWKEREGGKV